MSIISLTFQRRKEVGQFLASEMLPLPYQTLQKILQGKVGMAERRSLIFA